MKIQAWQLLLCLMVSIIWSLLTGMSPGRCVINGFAAVGLLITMAFALTLWRNRRILWRHRR